MKVIDGKFLEGHKVTVVLDEKQYTRRVYYRKLYGLYIVIKNRKYFEYEIDYEDKSALENIPEDLNLLMEMGLYTEGELINNIYKQQNN